MKHTYYNNNNHNKTKKVFSKKHFNSGEGFLTNVWGPLMWTYLHIMSFNYPNNPTMENKMHYRQFILSLQYVLPCKYCRINFTNFLKKHPLKMTHMSNRNTFSRYIYQLHESINTILHKKSNLTYSQVRERYEHLRSRCIDEPPPPLPITSKNITLKKKEKGCTESLYGKKSKCIINIVLQEYKSKTFNIDKKCISKKNKFKL